MDLTILILLIVPLMAEFLVKLLISLPHRLLHALSTTPTSTISSSSPDLPSPPPHPSPPLSASPTPQAPPSPAREPRPASPRPSPPQVRQGELLLTVPPASEPEKHRLLLNGSPSPHSTDPEVTGRHVIITPPPAAPPAEILLAPPPPPLVIRRRFRASPPPPPGCRHFLSAETPEWPDPPQVGEGELLAIRPSPPASEPDRKEHELHLTGSPAPPPAEPEVTGRHVILTPPPPPPAAAPAEILLVPPPPPLVIRRE